jgi:lipoprotein-releasing system permease protein
LFEFQIAKRLYSDRKEKKRISKPAVFIAVLGIAIGFIVMMVTVAVVVGFKGEIRSKAVGFNSDIQVSNYNTVAAYESHPIAVSDSLREILDSNPEILKNQRYSTKAGLIKTDDNFQGMILKGVGQEYDTSFFSKYIVDGRLPAFNDSTSTNEVMLSATMAELLDLKLNDRIYTYFTEDEGIKARRLEIVGIYQTNFYEYDKLYLLTDINLVNRLNKWGKDQYTGLEIGIANYDKLTEITEDLGDLLYDTEDPYGEPYIVSNIEQLNPQLFGWLALLDLNVWVILGLMMAISGFTVISGLLILILEHTQMIGLFKGLGATNLSIRKIFIWLAVFLIGKGLFWGNLIGLSLCFIQSKFSLIPLDPKVYHVSAIPVSVSFWWMALLNLGVIIISVLILVGPSYLVSKINPATSMRYE